MSRLNVRATTENPSAYTWRTLPGVTWNGRPGRCAHRQQRTLRTAVRVVLTQNPEETAEYPIDGRERSFAFWVGYLGYHLRTGGAVWCTGAELDVLLFMADEQLEKARLRTLCRLDPIRGYYDSAPTG